MNSKGIQDDSGIQSSLAKTSVAMESWFKQPEQPRSPSQALALSKVFALARLQRKGEASHTKEVRDALNRTVFPMAPPNYGESTLGPKR